MSEPVKIRQADSNESTVLSALAMDSKAYWGYSVEFMEACRDELSVPDENLRSKKFTCMVAELEDEIVGFYCLEQITLSRMELDAMFVAPTHIGTGIGRMLMEHAKNTAEEKGANSILIQGDPNAEKFYRAAGAQLVGERESESIPGRYLPLFTISLASAKKNVA